PDLDNAAGVDEPTGAVLPPPSPHDHERPEAHGSNLGLVLVSRCRIHKLEPRRHVLIWKADVDHVSCLHFRELRRVTASSQPARSRPAIRSSSASGNRGSPCGYHIGG